ncbi:phosphopantetheine-binding protein [Streptomyces sp. NPDC008159]|uniref:phosphopantetheine-binding protein n=1 Tax=Streptomyces sp. NPDC008159 TaxID=3364817 RepID=UPI0036E4EB1B
MRGIASRRKVGLVAIPRERSEVPETLARIWCRTLKVDSVGVHDDFFGLGGNSLSAIRVSMLAAKEFHVDVSAADLIADSLFSSMVERIRTAVQHAENRELASTSTGTEV